VDPITEEDAEFTYRVQALLPAGKAVAEGEKSHAVSVTYKDVFPPAVPSALTAIAGVGSIELTWEPNHEPDLRGYQVYRAEASGALAKLGEVTGEVIYSDKTVVHAKRYVYAVSAVDKLGNESKLSATIEISAP
jgi:fibronectin type 3 domain-containing protein